MITDTRFKLNEAEYFFENAKLCVTQHPINIYLLSAFVSAGRSVTFFMEKEFSKNEKFKNWWKNHPDKDAFFDKFNDLRVLVVHQRNPTIRHKIETTFAKGLNIGPNKTVEIPINLKAPHKSIVPAMITDQTNKTIIGLGEQTIEMNIIRECFYDDRNKSRTTGFDKFIKDSTLYLEKLEKIVTECESLFGLD